MTSRSKGVNWPTVRLPDRRSIASRMKYTATVRSTNSHHGIARSKSPLIVQDVAGAGPLPRGSPEHGGAPVHEACTHAPRRPGVHRRAARAAISYTGATARREHDMQSKRDRVTSIDIAHLAGVSQATVSRVLNGSPLVGAETRRRVEAAVRELGYSVDRRASNLRLQRSGTLALLLFEDPTSDDSHINPFFLSMLGSITRAAARAGYDLLVSFQQLSDDWHADYACSMKADGLILLGYGDYLSYRGKLEALVAHGTRFVRWGSVLPD